MQQNVETTLPLPSGIPPNFSDFKWGRVAMLPFLYTKRQRAFGYGGTVFPAVGAALTFATLQLDNDSHFLLESIQMWDSGQLNDPQRPVGTVQINDLSYGKSWSNNPIPFMDAVGMGSNPKYLTDPMLLRPNTVLQIGSNISNNTVYFQLQGRKVYNVTDDEWILWNKKQFYSYVLSTGGNISSGGATVILTTQVFNEADFLLKRIYANTFVDATYVQSAASSSDVNPIFNVRMTALDKSLQNRQISVLLNAGFMEGFLNTDTGGGNTFYSKELGNAFPIHPAVKVPRNSIIEVRVANPNLAYVLPGPVYITFEGVHVYD